MDVKSYLPGILGVLIYIVTREILPNWNLFLSGILDAFVFAIGYYLLFKKLSFWKRILTSTAVTLITVCVIRFILDLYS